MLREAHEVELIGVWLRASREDKRTLLMVLEASRESERVAENLWSVSPAELSWTKPPDVSMDDASMKLFEAVKDALGLPRMTRRFSIEAAVGEPVVVRVEAFVNAGDAAPSLARFFSEVTVSDSGDLVATPLVVDEAPREAH